MRRALPLLAVLLGAAGCNMAVTVDPEGYRCDTGGFCPQGYACREGVCRRDATVDGGDALCAAVTCDAPPPATCFNANTARTFAGRCAAGQCSYEAVDLVCPQGCELGACKDACAGVSCVTPPATACANATTLRTFAPTGACTGGTGQCDYVFTDTTCPNGCANARCTGVDLCASMGVVCNAPPAPTCVGASRRTFANSGTCNPGTGQCTYASSDMACPNGCAVGQCLTPSFTFTQVGPRVRFPINALDVAPGSSGNSALAAGNGGRLARWDGSAWTELTTPDNEDLHSVAFVTGTVAWVVGSNRTAWTVRPSSGQVLAVNLSGSGSANLVSVHGRSEGEVLIADDSGGWWRLRSSAWTNGTLPSANAPYTITGAYLDESLRERVVGGCAGTAARSRCVAYRNVAGGTPNWTVQTQAGNPGFTAVGGAFDVPTTVGVSEAAVGRDTNDLNVHTTAGFSTTVFFTSLTPSPALEGAGVVGITAQNVALNRDVYVLTSSGTRMNSTERGGFLYRLVRGTLGAVTATTALETYYGEEALSPNDANGVLVAEVRRTASTNNVFRRGPITNEALDVGEDFAGASLDDTGALVLASLYGDVVVRRPASATFEFRRPPAAWSINAVEARRGTGALLVGEELGGGQGLIARVTNAGFTTLATAAGTVFRDVCRASDTEGWAVGEGGVIFRVSGATAAAVASPTTSDLLSVDCTPGTAVACGANGTVLRWSGGSWAALSPAFPGTGTLRACRGGGGGSLFVGGDGFFSALGPSSWLTLPAKAGLKRLVARSPTEVYGVTASGGQSDVFRFNGATWSSSLLRVSGELGGGVQSGSQVVWGGTLGAIVEGR